MKLVNAERLRRIRRVGGKILASVRLQAFARRHLGGLRRRMKAKEQELKEAHARRLYLEPLIDNLRSLATTIRPYEATSTAPRVLLFTGHGIWSRETPLVDGLLYHALRQRDAECTAVLCGAALPACHIENVITDSSEELLARGQPKICSSCVYNGSRIYETLGVPFRSMRRVLQEPDYRRAREVVSGIPYEEYFEYRQNGVAIGAHARASVMRYLLSGRLPEGPRR